MQLVCPSCLAANRVPADRLADRPLCGRCHAALLPTEPLALSDASFDRYVGSSDMPVLVDFWADWCAPCQLMNPILADVARTRTDLRVAKVDTSAVSQVPARFNIRGIPTLILFRRGAQLGRLSGAMTAAQLSAWLDNALQQAGKERAS
jgi:thioredoxin 2